MQKMNVALRAAGVEHRRTLEIRETLAETQKRAKSAQMRAVRAGKAISLAERQRRAQAAAWAPKPATAPAVSPEHISNSEPWERLATAVVAAWR